MGDQFRRMTFNPAGNDPQARRPAASSTGPQFQTTSPHPSITARAHQQTHTRRGASTQYRTQRSFQSAPDHPEPSSRWDPQAYASNRGYWDPPPRRTKFGPPLLTTSRSPFTWFDSEEFEENPHNRNGSGYAGWNQAPANHQTRPPPRVHHSENFVRQASHLEYINAIEVNRVRMGLLERTEKDLFRQVVEGVCQKVCAADPDRLPQISLECFGSFKSGFASAGSDMDLVITVNGAHSTSNHFSLLEHDLPRALEKALLDHGYGARLLTKTRVPIMKICEKPTPELLANLRGERANWDALPEDRKYPHLYPAKEREGDSNPTEAVKAAKVGCTNGEAPAEHATVAVQQSTNTDSAPLKDGATSVNAQPSAMATQRNDASKTRRDESKPWVRERHAGPLDFPKTGVGIQCDVNFFNPLGLHNTHLLYCYAQCDDRVTQMVMFVKAWAQRRKINSAYSGTLSSYGYVLMVLHYLVHVTSPAVLPNLQCAWRPGPECTPQRAAEPVDGWDVSFWRQEGEIKRAKQLGQLTTNTQSLGTLLAGFFQYYSSMGLGPQFVWTQNVLSLRTPGGLLPKEQKGWTKAVVEEGIDKRIHHRYLFCIEDPFELSHNIARTVTHHGIVAIRDEFRRARRILLAVAKSSNHGPAPGVELFAAVTTAEEAQHQRSAARPTSFPITRPDAPASSPPPSRVSVVQHGRAVSSSSAHSTVSPAKSDRCAFYPALTPVPAPRRSKVRNVGNCSEISGAQAAAIVDSVLRKKAEAAAGGATSQRVPEGQ